MSHITTNRFNPTIADVSGTSGWVHSGTNVYLLHSTDKVIIGANAPVGAEKLRVVGSIRMDDATSKLAFLEGAAGQNSPVSNANEGRIRYNALLQRWECSENGGAYVAIATPGSNAWTRVGAVVSLTNVADTVAIGAGAMVGTEKMLIVGDLAFNAAPSTAGTLRFTDTNNATWRSGGVDYALWSGRGTDGYFGGAYPTRPANTIIEGSNSDILRVNGSNALIADASAVTIYKSSLLFLSTAGAITIKQNAPLVDIVATATTLQAQSGGAASAGAGKAGGILYALGGVGGAGAGALAAGAGGAAYFEGGAAGALGAGAGDAGGDGYFDGGLHSGAASDGAARLGGQHTSAIYFGNVVNNPTVSVLGSGSWTFGGSTVQFAATVSNATISQATPAADTAASDMFFVGQPAGPAAAAPGQIGGFLYAQGGRGAQGSGGFAAGSGGVVYILGGTAGFNGGGGGANGGIVNVSGGDATGNGSGGAVYVNGGQLSGGGANGSVYIGSSRTVVINLGNAADNTAITQVGTGAVTWHGNTDFHCAAVTATGNPTFNLGTNTTTAGTLTATTEASVGAAAGERVRTFILKGTSVDAGLVELLTASGGTLVPPVGSHWAIDVQVSCVCTAGTDVTRAASWHIDCGCNNPTGGGALAIDFPAQSTLVATGAWSTAAMTPSHYTHANLAAISVFVDVSGVGGNFRVRVQGAVGGAANTFKWTAMIRATEV